MTHDDARARFSALIDGMLDARAAAEVASHLEGCAACRAEIAQLRSTVGLLREVHPVQAPEGFAAGVRTRLEGLGRPAPRAWFDRLRETLAPVRWSWKTAAAVTAVVLVGVFTANVLREIMPSPTRTESRPGLTEVPRKIGGEDRAVAPEGQLGPQAAPGFRLPGAGAPYAAQPPSSGEPLPYRRVIRTGHVGLEVEKFDEVSRRLLAIAEGAGGFVADSSYADQGGVPRGTFVLRVPAARFSDVMRQIEGLGTVQSRQVSGQDVTEEFVDLEARVRNLERQEARLLTFMDRATKIPDLMAIENEVSRVRGEIERLTGRLRFLSNKVDLATIQAEVSQKSKKAPGGFWNFERTTARIQAAFLNTVRQILGATEGVLTLAASLLPLALVAALAWLGIRRSMRRTNRAV
jgi:Domain of unknown function (DUF4349)/Putative zinc-finger